jgi:hypothetical protein
MQLARLPGRPSAARLGGNETSSSGSDRKEEEEDRKEGEAAARAHGLGIVAHVPGIEQRECQGQGTTGNAKIDQCLGTHASRHPVDWPRHRPRSTLE